MLGAGAGDLATSLALVEVADRLGGGGPGRIALAPVNGDVNGGLGKIGVAPVSGDVNSPGETGAGGGETGAGGGGGLRSVAANSSGSDAVAPRWRAAS
jgi:hypothetical protein